MKTVEAAPPGIAIRPPKRPGFMRVGWATFLGYVVALLVLIPVGLGASYLGVDAFDLSDSSQRGVFYRSDVWSVLAEAFVGIFVTAVTAFFVRDQIQRQTAWQVPFGFTFVTLLVTGYAPAAALTPLYGVTALVSLVLATLVLRWRCEPAGAEPMALLRAVPPRYRRAATRGLALAVSLLAVYVLAYGATHPLRTDGSISVLRNGTAIKGGGGIQSPPRYARDPGAIERYVFPIRNLGPFEVRELAVTGIEGSPVFQLERAGIRAPFADRSLEPLDGLEMAPDQTRKLVLELRQGGECPEPSAQLEAVRVRFELLGGTFEERMPLVDRPTIHC